MSMCLPYFIVVTFCLILDISFIFIQLFLTITRLLIEEMTLTNNTEDEYMKY